MKKKHLFVLSIIFMTPFVFGQNGDNIQQAVNVFDYSPTIISQLLDVTASNLTPICESGGFDVFYKHTVSPSDNIITIGMETTFGVLTTINYQILRAPNGDINNLEEIVCDSYDIFLAIPFVLPGGGSFSMDLENVAPGDVYYLRVYKNLSLLGKRGILEEIYNNTRVEMSSENNPTLSINNIEIEDNLKVLVKNQQLRLINNNDFNNYTITSVTGQQVDYKNDVELLSNIDVSALSSGMYILNLTNEQYKNKIVKFVKK